MSPPLPGAVRRRWAKSDQNIECMVDKQVEHSKPTRNPFGHGSAHVDFPFQFIHHFEEAFDCVRYIVDHFQTFTYDQINCESGKCELQTIRVSITRRVPDQKKILTPAVVTKASFHERLANAALAHSLKSGVGVGELRVA